MKGITQTPIPGIDVSRDYLDGYFLPGGQRFRKSDTDEGHAQLIRLLVAYPDVVVCFEAILRSICGVGPVTNWMLIAELPEIGQIE